MFLEGGVVCFVWVFVSEGFFVCFVVLDSFLLVVWFGFVFGGFCVGRVIICLVSLLNFTAQVPHVVVMNMSPGDTKSFP